MGEHHGEHHREPIENLGNIISNKWEQNENMMATKELKNTILANPKEKKRSLLNVCSIISLAAFIFYS
jgi:hypothetical protein